jgi:hypothetical protein
VPPAPPAPPAAPPAAQPNPYAQPAGQPNPYAQPAGQPNPYAQPAAYGATPTYATPQTYGYVPKTNTLAIVSLVLAFFVSLGAVITGHIALSQIKRTGEGGRGLAIAGLVLGYLGIAVGIIFAIFWIAIFAGAAASGSFSTSGY